MCDAAIKDIFKQTAVDREMIYVLPGDTSIKAPEKIAKVLLVCGKHYYLLKKEREARGLQDVAIVRVEELCPFPSYYLQAELSKYSNAKGKPKHRTW